MQPSYVTVSGVDAKAILPTTWTPIDNDAFLRKMCRAIDRMTGRPWSSGDFVAMRAAEYAAASKLSESYGYGVTAEAQQKVAAILVDILARKPKWRSN